MGFFIIKAMVQLKTEVHRFRVSVLSVFDEDFDDQRSIGDLLSFSRTMMFFKRIITVLKRRPLL